MHQERFEQDLSERRAELQAATGGEFEVTERADRPGVPYSVAPVERVRNTVEQIDTIRLGLKYLAFDLDATRRENAALRARLRLTDPGC